MTLSFVIRRARVITHTVYTRTITRIQRSFGSTDGMETNKRMDGQTDATDYFTFPHNAAGNKTKVNLHFT